MYVLNEILVWINVSILNEISQKFDRRDSMAIRQHWLRQWLSIDVNIG